MTKLQLRLLFSFLLLIIATQGMAQKYVLCRPVGGGGSGSSSGPVVNGSMAVNMIATANGNPPLPAQGCQPMLMEAAPSFPLSGGGGGGISMFGTTRYGVDTIAYSWSGNTSSLIHIKRGHWSNPIAIGFPFCTFGQSYDSFLIAPNGAISFDLTLRDDTISNAVPQLATSLPNTAYAASSVFASNSHVALSLLDSFAHIRVQINGVYPCRKLVVAFDSIPVLDSGCTLGFMHSRILLYESNLIDIQIKSSPVCNTNTALLLGLQNAFQTSAYSVPNYNVGNQGIAMKSWRFFPNVIDTTKFLVRLYKNRVLVDSAWGTLSANGSVSAKLHYILNTLPPSKDTLHSTVQIIHTAQFCLNSGGGIAVGVADFVWDKYPTSNVTGSVTSSSACASNYAGTNFFSSYYNTKYCWLPTLQNQGSTNMTNVSFNSNNAAGFSGYVASSLVPPYTVSAYQNIICFDNAGCGGLISCSATMDWYQVDNLTAQSIVGASCASNGIGTIVLNNPKLLLGQVLPVTSQNAWSVQNCTNCCMPTPAGLTNIAPNVYTGPPGTYIFNVSTAKVANGACVQSPCLPVGYCKDCEQYASFTIPDLMNINTSSTQKVNICSGNSYTFNGHSYASSGTYVDTFTNIYGCDSFAILKLQVQPNYTFNRTIHLCSGDVYLDGTSSFNSAGNYVLHYYSKYGCDSIINLQIFVHPIYSVNRYDTICNNLSIHIGNHVHSQTGLYRDTFKTQSGCDSIIIEHLVVKSRSFTNITRNLCNGDSLLVGMNIYKQTGIYHDTLINAQGCDSIIVSTLNFYPNYTFNRTIHLCSGEVYVDGTSSFNSTGNYVLHYYTKYGCDSIINLQILVHPIYSVNRYDTICDNQFIQVGNYLHNQTGWYSDTLQSVSNCDSVINTNLYVKKRSFSTQQIRKCEGDSVRVAMHTYFASGIYHDTLSNAVGCDSIIVSDLYFEKPMVKIVVVQDTIYGLGETLSFSLNTAFASDSLISITPASVVVQQKGKNFDVKGSGMLTIKVVTETSLGCIASDSIRIYQVDIQMPGAFTPNGDNQNDLLMIRGEHAYILDKFQVFNRYGELMFSTNDFTQGWDGKYEGVDQALGTYHYVIITHARISNQKAVWKGNFELLR